MTTPELKKAKAIDEIEFYYGVWPRFKRWVTRIFISRFLNDRP